MKTLKGFTLLLALIAFPMVWMTGCSYEIGLAKQEITDVTPTLWFFKNQDQASGISDFYVKRDQKEIEKVASDISPWNITISEDLTKTLIMDENNSLYLLQPGKEKEKIGSDVMAPRFSPDAKQITYLSQDNELYSKREDKEKNKLLSDVVEYYLAYSGGPIYAVTSQKDLYLLPKEGEKEKLAFDVNRYLLSENGKTLAYYTDEQALYVVQEGKEKEKKIGSDVKIDPYSVALSSDGQVLAYLQDPNAEKGYGELYIQKGKEKDQKLASDVRYFFFDKRGETLFYVNSDDALYQYHLDSGEKQKMADDVMFAFYHQKADLVTYTTKDEELYWVPKGTPQKVGEEIPWFDLSPKQTLVYTTKDHTLYMQKAGEDKVKVAEEVKGQELQLNNLFYWTKDQKIFLRKADGKESTPFVDNIRKYSTIQASLSPYQNGVPLFMNTAMIGDITGFWTNGSGTYWKFEENDEQQLESYYLIEGEAAEWNYQEELTLNYATVDELNFDKRYIKIISPDEIEVDNGTAYLHRVTEGAVKEVIASNKKAEELIHSIFTPKLLESAAQGKLPHLPFAVGAKYQDLAAKYGELEIYSGPVRSPAVSVENTEYLLSDWDKSLATVEIIYANVKKPYNKEEMIRLLGEPQEVEWDEGVVYKVGEFQLLIHGGSEQTTLMLSKEF